MAVIKLGAFVTGIAGSVGGSTFRRSAGLPVLYNKSVNTSRNKLLKNNSLNSLVSVIRGWSALSDAERTNWNDASQLFQFPDKFGNLKNLTGRQLYIKLSTQLLNSTFPPPDPTTLSSSVAQVEILTATITAQSLAQLVLDDTYPNICLLIQAELLNNASVQPTFTRRAVLHKEENPYTDTFTFTTSFFDRFPYVVAGMIFRIYATPINSSGFKGITKEVLVTVG